MADTKISALSAASALDGTESIPVVQSTSTKKTPISAILTWIQTQALNLAANFAIATNKFTVAAASGNTAIAGTLGVTGAATLSSTLAVTTSAYVAAAPTVYTVYSVGSRVENTATTGTRGLAVFEFVADPSGASTAAHSAVTGSAQTKAGNAQNISSSGLYGVRGDVRHLGSGTLSNAFGFNATAFTNSGGGTITNAFGFYASAQTVGGTNWGFYAAGNASRFVYATGAPIQLTNTSAFRGALGSHSSVGTYSAYLTEYDGTDWIARSTAAGIARVNSTNFSLYFNGSGLTADVAYTPTQHFSVTAASTGTQAWFNAIPASGSTSDYCISGRKTFVITSSARAACNIESVANPASSSSGIFAGVWGISETDATCAQNITATAGLIGVRGWARNLGTAAVTGAASFFADVITNTGGGTITNAYSAYFAAQTAGTNNYSIYSAGHAHFNTTAAFTGVATFGAQINLKSYTVATLPSAATGGGMVWVSDAAGSACGALSNGTNWKRCDSMATTVT